MKIQKANNSRRRLTTHSTGAQIALLFIENLNLSVLNVRPVNSGVMSPLRVRRNSFSAAPLLSHAGVDEIGERLV
jgi:hypothetical protein